MFYQPDSSTRLMVVPVALALLALAGLLALAVIACALTSQVPANTPPTATNVPSVDVVVVPQQVIITPTIDIAMTLTAVAPRPTITTIVQQVIVTAVPLSIALPANCTIRTDWQPYVVQAGDTVGVLAIATNTPVADLVIGNCLANPDLIAVGQTLYLPRQPILATPIPTAAPGGTAPTIGFVLVEPSVVTSSTYLIAPGVITVRAQGVTNAVSVSFYMAPIGTDAAPTVLGVDNNLADGANIQWNVGATPLVVNVWAVATSATNVGVATDPILVAHNG